VLREIRQGVLATAREAETRPPRRTRRGARERVAEMVRRLDTGLDHALASLGEISARLEGEATGSRRLVERGRSLEHTSGASASRSSGPAGLPRPFVKRLPVRR